MPRTELEQQIASLTTERDTLAAGVDWSLGARGHDVEVRIGGERISRIAQINQRIANLRRRL